MKLIIIGILYNLCTVVYVIACTRYPAAGESKGRKSSCRGRELEQLWMRSDQRQEQDQYNFIYQDRFLAKYNYVLRFLNGEW